MEGSALPEGSRMPDGSPVPVGAKQQPDGSVLLPDGSSVTSEEVSLPTGMKLSAVTTSAAPTAPVDSEAPESPSQVEKPLLQTPGSKEDKKSATASGTIPPLCSADHAALLQKLFQV